ncbi:hypothetical protein I316_05403 [Kwoniella heveanensis BCC8398]|uniref:PARP-type domain-containing protein n=1 Tax=Kwoniella heveanensis BCC8398 TaxID=1296120 RepID=A0A1B9GP62_9TREE|nr:hypothetical protein I316_05403 [Kwoniella heveanensis BCC8398]
MPAYRLEVAPTARSQCNGPKPCKGTKIGKGELRLGVWVEVMGNGSFKWKHWGCVSEKVISNIKGDFPDPADLDGYDELPENYQEKVSAAMEEGHVADEDVPDSARKPPTPEGEEGEPSSSPAKKKSAPKKTKGKAEPEAEVNGKDGEAEKKSKKPRARKAKKEESEPLTEESEESEPEVLPKKKRSAPKKAAKAESDDEEDVKPAKKAAGSKRGKKIKAESDDEEEEVKPPSKKARKPRSRKKAANDSN